MAIRKQKGAAFVFYRFVETIKAQCKSFNSPQDEELKHQAKEMEQRLAVLNLFERFLETAPQVILQSYILIWHPRDSGSFKGAIFWTKGIALSVFHLFAHITVGEL